MVNVTSIIFVLIATIIGAFGALFLKLGSSTAKLDFNIFRNLKLMTGFVFYGLSSVFFLIALRHEDLSVLYLFISLSYVWVSFLSIRYLGEKMNLWKWAGIALIIIGVSLIGFGH